MALLVQPMSLPILYEISRKFVMLSTSGDPVAYQIATGMKFGRNSFINYCGKHFGNIPMTDSATNTVVNKNSGNIWWDWDDDSRRVVREVIMEPTSEPEDLHSDVLNRWYVLRQEMAIPNANAQIQDIMPLINHLMYISDGDAKGVGYFLNWLAELWRNPDVKIPTAIMLYSRNGRIGKSMLADLLAYVFGESMVKSIAGSKLYANFDDAVSGQRLIVLNELSKSDKNDRYETFKSLISEKKMEFEGKGRASNYQRNCTHWVITTNNADCLPLMDKDGRILVLRCESDRKDDAYYAQLADWMEGDGPELLAGCFANWQFPAGWDSQAPVPQTEATLRTQKESRNGLAAFVAELIESGKPPFDKDIGRCTALIEQLTALYPANMKAYRLNSRTLPAALRELGHDQMMLTFNTRRGTRINAPIWVWRNAGNWENLTGEDLGSYLGE